MSAHRLVHVYETRENLVATIADQLVDAIAHALEERKTSHIVLTGGSVGIEILAAVGEERRHRQLDWADVHLWWGDERWLPTKDHERNDEQAEQVFLSRLTIPAANIHRFPASDGALDLDAAAQEYARELADHSPKNQTAPQFDVVLLGMGPDGHIASLFPGHKEILDKTMGVLPVRNSPKPPPERLTLTLPLLNSAEQVWLCLAGADKASALGLALAGASVPEVPAAGAEGRSRTVFFVDKAAAAEVPTELLRANDHH